MSLDRQTDELVDAFAAALKAKLHRQQIKRGDTGKLDWMVCNKGDEWPAIELRQHIDKGDPLDVAALAAFCWFHSVPTNAGQS